MESREDKSLFQNHIFTFKISSFTTFIFSLTIFCFFIKFNDFPSKIGPPKPKNSKFLFRGVVGRIIRDSFFPCRSKRFSKSCTGRKITKSHEVGSVVLLLCKLSQKFRWVVGVPWASESGSQGENINTSVGVQGVLAPKIEE